MDDEQDIIRVATRTIEALGYGVVHAGNGEEGLALARKYRPDLVLADALMPRMDGRDMCRLIRDDPDVAETPVVVMTSLYTARHFRTEAQHVFKVDEYLAKPLRYGELRDALQRVAPLRIETLMA